MKKKNKPTGGEKNQSDIVTKESLCAVGAIFCALALFILCTGYFVFGEMGGAIRALLLGAFGYAAYPLFALGVYLGVTGLLGVRFVKNRKAAGVFFVGAIFLSLVLHTALTYGWKLDGYISACFKGGEAFSTCTVTGAIGGLFVLAVSSLTTKIGAIVIFSALSLLCFYLLFLFVRKKSKKSAENEQTATAMPVQPAQPAVTPEYTPSAQATTQPVRGESYARPQSETPVYGGYSNTPNAQNGGYGFDRVGVRQRPAFTIPENDEPKNNGFSPFGKGTVDAPLGQATQTEELPANGRDFLFGFSPAESYRKNLIFDQNANVNKKPTREEPPVSASFTPSYLSSYEKEVEQTPSFEAPKKVIGETPQYPAFTPMPTAPTVEERPATGFGSPYLNENTERTFDTSKPAYEPPISRTTFGDEGLGSRETENSRSDTRYDDIFGETRSSDRGTEITPPPTPVEPEKKEGNGRFEYSDIFTLNNPRIFGDDRPTDEISTRGEQPAARSGFEEMRGESEIGFGRDDRFTSLDRTEDLPSREEEPRVRDALNIFEEDEPLSEPELRTGRDSEIPFEPTRGARGGFETRDSRDIFTRDERGVAESARGVEEVSPAPVRKEEPKPTPTPPPKPRVIKPYVRVPIDYFDCRDVVPDANEIEVSNTKMNIIETLGYFKINDATISSVTFGPTVTRYNVVVPRHIPAKKVVSLDEDIALALQAREGVNVYPNFEDGAVSIEVPNRKRQFVQLGCMLTGDAFVNAKPSSLTFAMGKDVANRKVYGDICKMIHLLVAGSSGSGKSVFLGSLIISLITKYSPSELRLILIDPKKTEFVLYNNLPHLMINEIITEVGKAVQSLNWAIGEMNRRYGLFEQMSRAGTYVVNIDEYNSHLEEGQEKLPKIVIIIDELADLMLAAKKDIEDRIQNLTQKARAAGIHLIVATQRPSADVITGVIKSNLQTRIAFAVASDVDSRVILDQTGAQKLLGKGDFLYTMAGINTPVRVQSAFISSEESQNVINFIKMNNEAYFNEEATAFINNSRPAGDDSLEAGEEGVEEVYIEALRFVILSGSASISMIQRKCSVGYNKAGKIIEWMEEMGYISSFDGAKARKVLITKEEFESKFGAL